MFDQMSIISSIIVVSLSVSPDNRNCGVTNSRNWTFGPIMEKGERHDICPLASARAERQRVDARRSIFLPILKFGQRDLRGRQEAPAKPQFLSYFMHATFLDIFLERRERKRGECNR